jgi:phosphatidylserine/phosphatidylglycerophosphate/cardiolipin synthase-like enzyme
VDDPLLSLAPADLRALASSLRSGRLSSPYSQVAVQRFVRSSAAEGVASRLNHLYSGSTSAARVADTLELLASAVNGIPRVEEMVDVVTSGPQAPGISNRDTSVVVGDLFRNAEYSILIAGYAVHQGQRMFLDLADRMQQRPELRVRMYLNVHRQSGDTSRPEELIRGFMHSFRTQQWPKQRPLPEIFYDPRSLTGNQSQCAALHAKCVVVDMRELFVSSANFTEAAHERNIEIGLLVHSSLLAEKVSNFFASLVERGSLKQI